MRALKILFFIVLGAIASVCGLAGLVWLINALDARAAEEERDAIWPTLSADAQRWSP